MSSSWTQRLARLSSIIGTDVITDDEDRQGQALDEYLSSHGQTDQNWAQVNKLRFTDDDLSLMGKLAIGQFGIIDVVRCRLDSRVYVRKTIEKRTAIRARGQCSPVLERQILTLALKSRSVWVPHLLCAFQTDASLKLIMQYADGGSLWDLIESSPECKVSEADLKWWIPQMVSAIIWCHSQGFVHRDVKPHNFVLTPASRLLLVDFGSAAPLLPSTSSGVQLLPWEYCQVPCGTCDYISPEILECHEAALVALELEDETQAQDALPHEDDLKTYGRETDWWSLGAVIYEMAFGIAPFYASDIGSTYTKIMSHRTSLKLKEPVELSSSGVSLLRRLLCDKKTRLGRHSSSEIMEHEFFQFVHWSSLHQKPAPSVLHLPQFTYSETAVHQLESQSTTNTKDGYSDSQRYSRPFEFSVLFQSSNSASGVSFYQGTSIPKVNVPNPLNSFVGFSWGPQVNAFSFSDLHLDTKPSVLHQEHVDITPRPTLPLRMTDHSTVPKSIPTSHPFRTPIRASVLHGRPISVPRTVGTGIRSQGRRPLTDREAMQLLVDCVGMSARRKVLESGKKPKYIRRGDIQNTTRTIPEPIFTNMVMEGSLSTASSETESQPPSPSPRPGSALSRKSGWGGQSSTSLLQGRFTPTFTTTTMTGSGLLQPVNNSSTPVDDGLSRIPAYEQKLMEAEGRHERLLEDLLKLERNIGEVSLRLSQRR